MREPWPSKKGKRPPIPTGVLNEIKLEAAFQCAICKHGNDGEAAHIDPVSKSRCNHPHNLLWTCPNHHTAYDFGHKVHASLDESGVKFVKQDLRNAQARAWRAEYNAVVSLLAQVRELTQALPVLKKQLSGDLGKAVHLRAVEAIKSIRKQAKAKQPRAQAKFASAISAKLSSKDAVRDAEQLVEEVVEAGDQYLREEGLVACPVCKGAGWYEGYDSCPACGGEAYLPDEAASNIDPRDYRSVDCPICKGRGSRSGGDTCRACGGEGQMEQRHAEQLDRRDYKPTQCPLCKGSGRFRERDSCPVCDGEGEVERAALAEIDLSRYKLVKCRLCRGDGRWEDYDECPACGGEGSLEAQHADDMDWSQWKQ